MTNLALIGNGKWSKTYQNEVKKLPDVQIKYVKTHDYRDLLEKSDIDGIIICTPDSTHGQIIADFPNKYLLVEKPFALSEKEALKIRSKKIMVGHTYIYDLELQRMLLGIGQIKEIEFTLYNKEEEDVDPFWYLAPHGVAISYWLLGRPQEIKAWRSEGNHHISLKWKFAKALLSSGQGNLQKKRKLIIKGDKTIETDFSNGKDVPKLSPLQNQIQQFVNFINGQAVPTNIKHAHEVTRILDVAYKLIHS